MTYERCEKRKQRVLSVLQKRHKNLTFVINNIHDPHNVSAIYRSCDAFGVGEINLLYTSEKFPTLGRKSSASARKWVETNRHSNAQDLLTKMKERGFQCVRTGFSDKAIALHKWDFTKPTAVILGNEHRGIDAELCENIEQELYIPMYGMVQSLNVSVAAAIILYETIAQLRAAGLEKFGLSEDEITEYFARWSIK